MKDLGLYLHLPFCRSRCGYCAFVSVAGRPDLWDPYLDALVTELAMARERLGPRTVDTVYLGGGTPTLLGERRLGRLLEAVAAGFRMTADAEVTVEANPGTVDAAGLSALRQLGCNRLSLGVQSFHDAELVALGRTHGAAQALTACGDARLAGFDNLSLDLIFSIPGATLETWSSTLDQALDQEPEHLSVYGLTVEEGTALAAQVREGQVPPVDEDLDARLFAVTGERLGEAGYEQYEVSNYARPGRRSRHNWGYWTGAEYLGVGVSAHTFLAGRRSWNTDRLVEYLDRIGQGRSPESGGEVIDRATARRERIWLGLRTDRGLALTPDERQRLAAAERVRQLTGAGYLELGSDRLTLTRSGLAVADALGLEVSQVLGA
ncbi:MAG: radical SAM family heme chaperone HemW [Candidatus Latescibacterota bacterium]|jgi:oxygen-independent coproporphyrinogen-3 oxidase